MDAAQADPPVRSATSPSATSPSATAPSGTAPSGTGAGRGDQAPSGRRGDTRARIQQVALELFAEHGYERTSLREIAERLGVTKAALYYHFKSKEDIVRSFTEDHFSRLDALIAWGADQRAAQAAGAAGAAGANAATAHELLERYITIVMESGEVFRFLERNQATIHRTEDGKQHFAQFRPRLKALIEIITGPDASQRTRIRAAAALFAVSTSCIFFMKEAPEPDADALLPSQPTKDELRAIVLEIATDLTPAD
jgi:AcrR family transcriptional regulator